MPCFDISSSVLFLLLATFMQYMYVCRPDIGIFFLISTLGLFSKGEHVIG